MRFSSELRQFADDYRQNNFGSNDKDDQTDIWQSNWDKEERQSGSAKGGNYLAVHLRYF